jgi:hypothetical protein
MRVASLPRGLCGSVAYGGRRDKAAFPPYEAFVGRKSRRFHAGAFRRMRAVSLPRGFCGYVAYGGRRDKAAFPPYEAFVGRKSRRFHAGAFRRMRVASLPRGFCGYVAYGGRRDNAAFPPYIYHFDEAGLFRCMSHLVTITACPTTAATGFQVEPTSLR